MAISNSNELNQSSSSIGTESPEFLTVMSEKYVDTLATEKSHGFYDSDIIASRRNNLKCYFCSKVLRTRAGFINHEKKHLRKEFKDRRKAMLKQKKKPEFSFYSCPECNTQYTRKVQLTRHMKQHRAEYVCDYCHQSFKDLMDFEWHDAINDGINFRDTDQDVVHRTRSRSRLSCHKAIEAEKLRKRSKSVPMRMSYTPISRSGKRPLSVRSLSPTDSNYTSDNEIENDADDLVPMDIEEDAKLDDEYEDRYTSSTPRLNGIYSQNAHTNTERPSSKRKSRTTSRSRSTTSASTSRCRSFTPTSSRSNSPTIRCRSSSPIHSYDKRLKTTNTYGNLQRSSTQHLQQITDQNKNISDKRHMFKYHMCTADPNCLIAFCELDVLVVHERMQHKRLPLFKCKECRKGYTSEELYNVHRYMEHDSNLSICILCDSLQMDEQSLQCHLREHKRAWLNNKQFTCQQCNKEFLSSDKLETHLIDSQSCRETKKSNMKIIRIDSNRYVIRLLDTIEQTDANLLYGSFYYDDEYNFEPEYKLSHKLNNLYCNMPWRI